MIDAHLHLVSAGLPGGKPKPPWWDALLNDPAAMAQSISEEMERSGIDTVLAMGSLSAPADDPLGINGSLRIAALTKGVKIIGAADPRKSGPEHFAAVDRVLTRERGRVVALKAYLGYLHFHASDPRYRPYYELAEKHDIPVVLHTGDTWSTTAKLEYAHPLKIDEVAVDHPRVRFVIAHFGNPWILDAAAVIYKNDNVWTDLSGLVVGDRKTLVELARAARDPRSELAGIFEPIRRGLLYTEKPDRWIFGTDWPLVPIAEYRELVEAVVPEEHHAAVFTENPRKLFRLEA
ncbi:MAG: amidohydrolase family protein [Isosphaeraceae bacterium]|nr:amidohydrolase family protein [Isosphaeraceae bacterium]